MAEASAKRVTGDEPQGTMGRAQTPSRLPLRAHFHQKRDVWVRGSDGDVSRVGTPRETSPAAKNEEERMFSQASVHLHQEFLRVASPPTAASPSPQKE